LKAVELEKLLADLMAEKKVENLVELLVG